MKDWFLAMILLISIPPLAIAADAPSGKTLAKPAASKVDPALEAAHIREDVRRHRIIAAAHEAAAKCQESGKNEDICDAELAKACANIAYGKYCGMKHPD
jgi:hypothetical protein